MKRSHLSQRERDLLRRLRDKKCSEDELDGGEKDPPYWSTNHDD